MNNLARPVLVQRDAKYGFLSVLNFLNSIILAFPNLESNFYGLVDLKL